MKRRASQLLLLAFACGCGQDSEAPVEPTVTMSAAPRDDITETTSTDEELVPPGPREPIDGVHGFIATSRIDFEALPDSPHRVSATYTFPDRARWHIEPANASTGQRTVIYRSGPQAWGLTPGSGEAVRAHADDEARVLLQLELRRAAMIWPRGVEWRDGHTETQGVQVRIAEVETGGLLGARSETSSSTPSSFYSELPGGGTFEELRDLEWTDGPLGLRPERWTLFSGGAVVWTETIESMDTSVRYVDGHFLPPHLRELPPDED